MGKSVLITGAGRGIGRGLLEEFWHAGYKVFPVVRKEKDVISLRTSYTKNCHPILADITEPSSREIIEKALGAHTNALDILINNAGIPGKGHLIESVDTDEVVEGFKVHCIGVMHGVQGSLSYLKRSERGKIINMSSRLGSLTKTSDGEFIGRKFSYSYRMAKAAQNMLSICLNNELKDSHIGVISIHPGLITTDSGASDATEPVHEAVKRLRKFIENAHQKDFGTYQYPGHGSFPW